MPDTTDTDSDENTFTVDVVVFQETVGDAVLAPARLGADDAREELGAFGVDPARVDELVRTLADGHVDDVPLIEIPPPAGDDDTRQGVYKIGEVTINQDGNAVASRFDEDVRSHGHLGKGNVPTASTSG